MGTKQPGRHISPLARALAVLLSFAFALSGVPVTAVAETEALAQQELLPDGEDLVLEDQVTSAEDDLADPEDAEGDFGPVDETQGPVLVADPTAQAEEPAAEAEVEAEEPATEEVEAEAEDPAIEIESLEEEDPSKKPEVEATASSALTGTPSSTNISLNKIYSGTINPSGESAYYKFTLASQTRITVAGTFNFNISGFPWVWTGLMSTGSSAPTSAFTRGPSSTSWRQNYYSDKCYLDADLFMNNGSSALKLSDTSTYSLGSGSDAFKSITLPKGTYYFFVQWDTSCDTRSGDSVSYSFKLSTPATRDISKSTCKASITTQAWTGKQVKPTPTVKWGSTTLKKGTHYKVVKYGTNKNNGTANNWVKIQGIGSYKGTRTVKFRIKKPNVLYYVHRQTYGWEAAYSKSNGQPSGTTGQSKRLEGICIKLSNMPVSGGIQYRTHVQTYGWQGWKKNGAMSGTSGQAKRLEAIQIKLTGSMAKKYDVFYRVHAQHFGWMGWAKNGAKSGTAGYAYRLESIQIVLKPKGSSAPPAVFQGARRATSAAFKQKTYTNADAHNAYMNTLRSIRSAAPSHDKDVYYAYIDIYGSKLDELVCVSRGGGSARILRIYTFASGKVKKMLDTSMYGDNWYEFYKSCNSFVMYCSGHGGEMYRYFQVSGGTYKEVAYMSRQSTAGGGSYDGPWGYYIGGSEVSESRFYSYTMDLTTGDVGHLQSHYNWKHI